MCSFQSVPSGIRSLQCILLKICLLLGVQIHTNVEFVDVVEPDKGIGWRASVKPESHQVNKCEFDFIVGKLYYLDTSTYKCIHRYILSLQIDNVICRLIYVFVCCGRSALCAPGCGDECMCTD